jgi:ABC-type transport system substrate-binding protein
MRKAVNHAVDRGALTRLVPATSAGDPGAWLPTDQYLSPAVTGFHDADVYPLGRPDVATARRLAHGRRGIAVLFTCDTSPCPEETEVLRQNLGAIGLRLRVRRFPLARLYEALREPEAGFDIGHYAWIPDYPDPANVLDTLFHSGSDWYPGGFANRRWDGQLEAASRLSGPDRHGAFGLIDAKLAGDAAPAVAVGYQLRYDFFSDRIGCQLAHPVYGIDLTGLCLRGPSNDS